MNKAVAYEKIDTDGNLQEIEFRKLDDDDFIIVSLWDPSDPQDAKHRADFRAWSELMLKRLGYEVVK